MKRIVCLLIAALSVSLLLGGCGQNSDPLAIREFIIGDSIGTVEQRGSGKDAEYVIRITLPIETDFQNCTANITLADGASLKAAMGYLGRKQQVIDLNLAVDHVGRNTRSDIDVSGALSDSAKKVFRGTIDFKNGSAGSTGSEQETVLLLGDDVVNRTVPLILCAEENVEGTHGATIGALDDDTLFYFESRGFDRDAAERLMARAAVERLAHDLGDDATAEAVQHELNGGM